MLTELLEIYQILFHLIKNVTSYNYAHEKGQTKNKIKKIINGDTGG